MVVWLYGYMYDQRKTQADGKKLLNLLQKQSTYDIILGVRVEIF